MITKFGFDKIVINGQYRVWTCKLSIERGVGPLPVIAGVDMKLSSTTSKKGKVTEKMIFSYATMDESMHRKMQKELMLFMEQHAIRQVKKRYTWLHDEPIPTEQELSMVEPAVEMPW